VPVNFMPFQYNPVTKKLTLNDNVTIEISYSSIEMPAVMEASLLADTVFDNLAPAKFINYDEVSNRYGPAQKAPPAAGAAPGYVIITTNAIVAGSGKLSSFIAHKQSLGYSVQVVTENDFNGLTGQAPNHRAEKIRQWLKSNYISNDIKYALLIGNPTPYENGEGDIPMKMCWPRRGASDGYQESPTDYFYADLTGNWDRNANQYYGEWADYTASGGVDLAADVYVGRIPVYGTNYAALDSILQKTMNYETSSSAGWRKSALLPMSWSDSSTDGAYLSEQMRNDYLSSKGYSCWRMYQHGRSGSCTLNSRFSSEENLSGGSVVPNRWAGSDFGIVAWWGHGNSQGTYVGYGSCNDGSLMLSSDAPRLDDAHPSHTYQCSCENGYPEDSNNLQYAILKNGGITTTAATRVSWYYKRQQSFATSPSNAGMGYEYVKRLVQGQAAGDSLYAMKSSGVSSPSGYPEILMNFYDFCLDGDPSLVCNIGNAYLCNTADIVLVFDTTGRMGSSIESMKANAISFANALASAGVDYRLGLTECKDFPVTCDSEGCGDAGDFAYKIYNSGNLVSSATTFNSWISSLSASGGNDLPEAHLAALKHTVTDQKWRGGAVQKFIILISDAPHHADSNCCNQEGDTIAGTKSILQSNGVRVFIAGEDAGGSGVPAGWATDLSSYTKGKYYPLGDLTPILNDILALIPCSCLNPSFGVYRPMTATFWLDTNNDGLLDKSIKFGRCGDVPLSGDWDGDGIFGIGVFRPEEHMFYLDNNLDGKTDIKESFGNKEDIPVTGDWDGDRKFGIGVFRPQEHMFYLDNNLDGKTDIKDSYGGTNDQPVTGDWNKDGKDGIGVYRQENKMFYFDDNLDGKTDSTLDWGSTTADCLDHRLCDDVALTGKCWLGTFAPSKHTFYTRNTKSGRKLERDYDDSIDIPLTGSWK
jgi:hypothetical protein